MLAGEKGIVRDKTGIARFGHVANDVYTGLGGKGYKERKEKGGRDKKKENEKK